MKTTILSVLAVAITALPPFSIAQAPDPRPVIAAQKEAMAPLAYMDGAWRGSAWTLLPSGEKHLITQTERIGAFLDGTVKVIEGRGYEAAGKVSFNALGIISYDAGRKAFSMRSYAMGRSGDFPITLKPDGFTWEIAQGPAKIVYAATVKNNTWHEVGDRVVPGRDPVRFFEMKLDRIGDTDWPAGSPVPQH